MENLYPRGIRGAKRLSVQDLRAIAHFNKVIKNYLKMCKLLKQTDK